MLLPLKEFSFLQTSVIARSMLGIVGGVHPVRREERLVGAVDRHLLGIQYAIYNIYLRKNNENNR